MQEEPKNTDVRQIIIWLVVSLFLGAGLGYWAYVLDPKDTGGSILILPAAVGTGLVSFSLLITGLITRNESYGPSLVLAAIIVPIMFFGFTSYLRGF